MAEAERLREALRQIQARAQAIPENPIANEIEDLARAALAEGGTDEVRPLFEFWKAETGRSRARFTAGRQRALRARLREGYEPELIRRAIRNVAHSDFHQGRNDRHRRFDDLTLICRSGEKLESYAEMTPPSGAKGVFVG